ncbi:MAG: hypothetical protein CMJ28_04815 [Phycisphaerae bacterium]|nr:hypothetical protein [Phycisphaerae bacterium]
MRRAFSLIELLIAIAILVAIGALVAQSLSGTKAEADLDLTKADLSTFGRSLERFEIHMNRVPSEEEGVAALWSSSALEDEDDAENWRGPYVTKPIPEDRWGTEWRYAAPSELVEGMLYDIVSAGPDREFDTEDDLHNHMAIVNADGELREGMEDFGGSDDFGLGGDFGSGDGE